MDLPRDQLVSDLLHQIADLIQEADAYLCESSLSPTPFAKGSKGRPSLSAVPFAKIGKKNKKGKSSSPFTAIKRPSLRKGGIQPFKATSIENRTRRSAERINRPASAVLRARRERAQRSRYASHKLVQDIPRKILGKRLRKR